MVLTNLADITNAFYINLEHRTDRREHVEQQLASIGLNNVTRFNAIKTVNGAIGCSMSHLRILEDADKAGYDHVLIVEDDIKFLDPELFKHQINGFFKLRDEEGPKHWDVVLLAGNNIPPYKPIDDTCIQVFSCQTTTGYIVNGHYIKTLMQNIKRGLINLINTNNKPMFAIDRYWFSLQRMGNWYLIVPLTVVQRQDYSDIEKRFTNYEKMMLSERVP